MQNRNEATTWLFAKYLSFSFLGSVYNLTNKTRKPLF